MFLKILFSQSSREEGEGDREWKGKRKRGRQKSHDFDDTE